MNMLTISMFAVLFCCTALTTGTLAKDCIGDQCPQIVSVGLMDDVKATLKADLDVSKLNNVLFKYIQKEVTKAVKSEVDKLQGNKCIKGSTFARWGRSSCDGTKSSLVYTGFMAGPTSAARGSGSNYLCLSSNPETKSFPVDWNQRPGHLYGIGWELTEVKCGSIPCSKYGNRTKLSCVVCSK